MEASMSEPHHELVSVMKNERCVMLDSLSYEKRKGTNKIKMMWEKCAVGDYKGSHTT